MNKIKIILTLLFLLNIQALSQYTLIIKLVESDGTTPNSGESSNITFTKYPHSFPTDAVSGITVTEAGTTGTYKAKGFTVWQHVKMWLSGVEYTAFDSIQTGSINTFISDNYISKMTTQTGISGNKTLTGTWNFTAGNQTLFYPYINSSSGFYSDYSTLTGNSLVFRNYADSIYGIKPWFYDGANIRLNTGVKLYGRTNTTSPIGLNTSHFSYSSDQLSLNSSVLNADSIKHKNLTVGKDTTWTVLGEPVTKWRFLSLKKGFWYNAYTIPDWKWVYTSFDESGVLQAMDSMMVINEALEIDNETSVSAGYDGTYTLIDSLTLPPGKYLIDFGAQFVRPDHNDAAQINISDTVEIALKEESSAPNTYIKRYVRNIHTYLDTNNLDGDVLNWGAVHTVYSTAKKIYLYGRYLAQSLATAIGSGPTVSYTRGRITATLIR